MSTHRSIATTDTDPQARRHGFAIRLGRTALALAAALLLALPAAASAQVLSEDAARAQADDVAGFVAGVLSSEYRLRGYRVGACVAKGAYRVVCKGQWHVAEQKKARTRWACTANILVWLDDPESDATDWDYSRIRCKRSAGPRAARGVRAGQHRGR